MKLYYWNKQEDNIRAEEEQDRKTRDDLRKRIKIEEEERDKIKEELRYKRYKR